MDDLGRTRQELEASERKYLRLFNWAPVAYFALDRDTVIQEVNLAGAEMLGFRQSHLVGTPMFLYVAHGSRSALEAYLRAVLEGAGSSPIELTLSSHDGGAIPVAMQGILLHDGAESGPLYLMAAMDISHRKRAEEALPESEAELTAIFEGAPTMMVLVDQQRRVRKANRATVQFVGRSEKEIVGNRSGEALRCIHSLDDPKGCGFGIACQTCPIRVSVLDTFETSKNHQAVETVFTFQSGEGRAQRNIQVSTSVFDVSDEQLVLVCIEDITARKQAEKALRETEQRFRSLVETTSDWVWEVDQHSVYTYASPKVRDLLGYEPEEVVGKKPFDLMLPEEAEQLRPVFRDIVASRSPIERLENVNLHKDGQPVVLETSAVPVLDADGNLLGYRGIDRDITQRKQAEAEVRAAQEKLLKQQRRDQKRVERANRELEHRNRELQDFAYVVSHDLRAPLVNIQGFSGVLTASCDRARAAVTNTKDQQTLMAELGPLLDEEIPDALGYIRTSSSKMDTLLAGLLKISRIGSAALTIEELDMNRIVSEIIESMKFSLEDVRATVQVAPLSPCRGDRTQVGQVFSNLLDNAVKYREPARPGAIRISACQEARQVVYCVQDNGIGIDPEHQDAIFQLFHRLDPDQGDGLGLGLTIVGRIVDRHGGRIWVESAPNEGSRFYVSLPCA